MASPMGGGEAIFPRWPRFVAVIYDFFAPLAVILQRLYICWERLWIRAKSYIFFRY